MSAKHYLEVLAGAALGGTLLEVIPPPRVVR
jgi:hypothetical protein